MRARSKSGASSAAIRGAGVTRRCPSNCVCRRRVHARAARPRAPPSSAAMFRILRETPDDSAEVEFLYRPGLRPGRTALSSYRLRDGVDPVAGAEPRRARRIRRWSPGAIRYWPVRVGEAGTPALLLGPVAVHPTRQGEGLGALLITESLERAASAAGRG